jgi:hypothetical protein
MAWIRLRLALFGRRLRGRARRAQAMIESAIVIPLMTFLILGVLQLAMIQHARLMTEYAAFNAARAGIVWNADPWIMENAAIISLMPTYENLANDASLTDPVAMIKRIVMRALLYQVNRRLPEAMDLVRNGTDQIIGQLPESVQGSAGNMSGAVLGAAEGFIDSALRDAITGALGNNELRMVQVNILNPTLSDLPLRDTDHDFDAVLDPDQEGFIRKTRLSISVRYLYLMRIPFANWIMHQSWRAYRAGTKLYGAVHNAHGDASDSSMLGEGGKALNIGQGPRNLDQELKKLADKGIYLLPLRAQYSMRMQSNPYRVSLTSQAPPDN